MDRNAHPNMLGAAFLAAAFGVVLLGLSLFARLRGEQVEAGSVVMGAGMLALAALAAGLHRKLSRMSPEERDRFWSARDAEWRETAAARARAELGRDLDDPSTRDRRNDP